jgi:hypothetical protein
MITITVIFQGFKNMTSLSSYFNKSKIFYSFFIIEKDFKPKPFDLLANNQIIINLFLINK